MYESIGQDLGLLTGAVSQLVSDVEANPIDADDVRDYFAGVADVSGFTIADAVWERRYAEALRTLRQAMLVGRRSRRAVDGVVARDRPAHPRARRGHAAGGFGGRRRAARPGVPPWKVKILRKQWSRWSGDQRRLAASVVALADADGAMKGGVLEGSSLDPEQKLLALEILVATDGRVGESTADDQAMRIDHLVALAQHPHRNAERLASAGTR